MYVIILIFIIFPIIISFIYALSMIRYYEKFCFQNKILIMLFGPRKKKPVGKKINFYGKFVTEEFELEYKNQYLRGQIIFSEEQSQNFCFLLPGFNRSYFQMENEIREFLALNCNVVCFDYLGSGLSDGKKTSLGYDEAEQLKNIFEYVSAKFEINQKFVFGHSMGTITALWCNKRFDIKFDSFFLESSYSSLEESIATRLLNSGLNFLPISKFIILWCCLLKNINYFQFNLSYLVDRNTLDKYIFLHGKQDKKSDASLLMAKLKKIGFTDDNLILFKNGGHESMYGVNNIMWREAVTDILIKTKIIV